MPARPQFLAFTLAIASLSVVSGSSQTPQVSKTIPAFPDGHDTPLGRQIHELLRDPAVSRAHWGIAVTNLQGVPIFGLNEGKLFRPASTAKLFTMAAALSLLGPEFHFHTRVYGDLDSVTGVVRGDLTLLGGGDPSFGTEDLPYRSTAAKPDATLDQPGPDSLEALADHVARLGVKEVSGNVVGDDSLFEPATTPQGWAEEDLVWGYGALPSALAIGDNELQVTIEPGMAEEPVGTKIASSGALVSVAQLYPYLHVVNQVTTPSPSAAKGAEVDAEALPGSSREVRLFGVIPPGTGPVKEHFALPESALYAAGALRALLTAHGVPTKGDAIARHAPPLSVPQPFLAGLRAAGCETTVSESGAACDAPCPEIRPRSPLLAEHLSAPLMDDVAFTLKTSANLHAENIIHLLGLRLGCSGASTLQGARVLRTWMLGNGIEGDDVLLYDGSGLSTKDLVTPRAEAEVLAVAAAQPWFPRWRAALPIGGVDGTLATRFTNPPLKGHVFAKTGTLGETRALAGYIQCASGQQLIFSILVDNHQPGTQIFRETMDQIVADIAELN